MDYIGYKCPVCDKNFHVDDDIVVCPVCGTPHHRDCYDTLGHCFNEDKHKNGFIFETASDEKSILLCPKCRAENSSDSVFCNKCGERIKPEEPNGEQVTQNQTQAPIPPFFGMPFGNQQNQGQPTNATYSPLGTMTNETVLEDDVTAGEVAKYVKTSVPYFMRIFGNFKATGSARFNFCGFLFSGGYLLYRKQYKPGIIFTVIMVIIMLSSSLITISDEYANVYNEMLDNANISSVETIEDSLKLSEALYSLPIQKIIFYASPEILRLLQYLVMFIVGFKANKMYYKQCIREVKKIKETAKTAEEKETLLTTKGGINMPLAFSLLVVYMAINYIPLLFL